MSYITQLENKIAELTERLPQIAEESDDYKSAILWVQTFHFRDKQIKYLEKIMEEIENGNKRDKSKLYRT